MVRQETRRLVLGLTSVGTYFLALQSVGSIPARYSRDMGIGIAGTGIIWSSAFFVSLAFRPLAGHLADKTSSYLAMLIGGAVSSISSLIYLKLGSSLGILAGRLLQGLGNAFFMSPSIVAVSSGGPARMALALRAVVMSLAAVIAPHSWSDSRPPRICTCFSVITNSLTSHSSHICL